MNKKQKEKILKKIRELRHSLHLQLAYIQGQEDLVEEVKRYI